MARNLFSLGELWAPSWVGGNNTFTEEAIYDFNSTVEAGDYIQFDYTATGDLPTIWSVINGVTDVEVIAGTSGTFTSSAFEGDDTIQLRFLNAESGFSLVATSEEPFKFLVYELEKGWSFDGYYIPHFLELNWYFGDDPVTYHGIQKIRVHGLSKGRSYLQLSTNGMQTDYLPDYSAPQYIDLPHHPTYVSSEFLPVTNWTDSANRGLSIQMKFEGRNTDITQPEPAHVLQVLVVQSSPQSTGARGN